MQGDATDEATEAARSAVLEGARQRREASRREAEAPAPQPISLPRKAALVARFRAKQALQHLPGPLQRRMTRRRHLQHVTVNMGHLTPPALLGTAEATEIGWISPEGLPEAPIPGLGWEPLDDPAAAWVSAWLAAGTYDDDAMLDGRMDGQGDELGRTRRALAARVTLGGPARARRQGRPGQPTGTRILVDARSLQSAAFGTRGIGRFASAAVRALREAAGDARVDLLVDRALPDLPEQIAGTCRQVTRISEQQATQYSYLFEPSPMTASPEPLIPVLASGAHKTAIVFDYIPMHLPDVYVPHVAARAEYAASLDALRCYDEFLCISHMVKDETARILGCDIDATVAWPSHVLPKDAQPQPASDRTHGPIILMTGDDARKNTFGGLAGIGAATSADATRDVVVLGMAGQGVRVHHWSIAAMMRPGEATTLDRISDEEMVSLLASASLVVVPSFDEGLSLPVIEASLAGTPIVASDIPSHRELLGSGNFLADPRSPADIERAVRRHRGKAETATQQWQRLAQHQHDALEEVVTASVAKHAQPTHADTKQAPPAAAIDVEGRRLRVGVATPWSPQKSGVADYSVTTISALAEIADVTVYTTSDATVDESIASLHVGDAPDHADDHDVFLTVLGNSHFHLPHLDLLDRIDTVALSHDTRMVEFYMALRGAGGAQDLMLRGTGRRALDPDLDEQVNDMRLLQNAGFWEIARRASLLITHSPCASPTISAQTHRPVEVLPFANYRRPKVERLTEPMRAQARRNLGIWDDSVIHLASFGYIDTRTKLTDTVVEAAAWQQQWGRKVHLHLVGSASAPLEAELTERAERANLTGFTITGYAPESTFRDYLLGVDLGIQLRVSPLLGVSGPLSDMAAYGTPAIASSGLAIDVDTPAFIDRLPDDVSPVMVAEAIETALSHPQSLEEREALRREYLAEKSPQRYAEQLLGLLQGQAQRKTQGGAA